MAIPGPRTSGSSVNGPAISTSGLTKRYGTVVAVDALSITVERGEIFGFLGPNGAGKTTTMRMLLGLVAPSAGSASMLGLSVKSDIQTILSRTGAIIENPTFYPFLSGRANLDLVAKVSDSPKAEVDHVLAIVDLTKDADRKFKKYSLGMKQRLAVAASLIGNPDLLILDEPANGLDPAGIVDMRTLMKGLKDEGKTVFISSHVLSEIEQICDRVAILSGGKVVVQGRVSDLLRGSDEIIEIAIEAPDRAATILQSLTWVVKVVNQNGKLQVSAPMARSSELNRALAEQGLYASEIKPREESLEQYFLEVTGAADA